MTHHDAPLTPEEVGRIDERTILQLVGIGPGVTAIMFPIQDIDRLIASLRAAWAERDEARSECRRIAGEIEIRCEEHGNHPDSRCEGTAAFYSLFYELEDVANGKVSQ